MNITHGAVVSHDSTVYLVVRESRPVLHPLSGEVEAYVYNLLNLATGKMRRTDTVTFCRANNLPFTLAELSSCFGMQLKLVAENISEVYDVIKAHLSDALEDVEDENEGPFVRGSIFMSLEKQALYVLARESRPLMHPLSGECCGYVYNLFNLSNGKARYTEQHRSFKDNEPIDAEALQDRFGLDLVFVAEMGDVEVGDTILQAFPPVSPRISRVKELLA